MTSIVRLQNAIKSYPLGKVVVPALEKGKLTVVYEAGTRSPR